MRLRHALMLVILGGCSNFDALSSGYGRDLAIPPDDMAIAEDLASDDLSDADLASIDAMNGDIMPICNDSLLGPGETDIDCGGACAPCDVGRLCVVAADCQTSLCDSGRCALATAPPNWVQVGTAPTNPNTPPIPRNDLVVETGPDGNLYAISGLAQDGTHLNDVEKLDQAMLTWTATSNIGNRRSLAASTTDGSGIFLLYGEKGGGFENTVERMTTAPNWTTSTGLSYSVSGAGAALGGDGHIYVVGGFDGANALKNLRAYNPGDTTLTTLTGLTNARERHGVARGSDGRIYAIGGHAGTATLDSLEAYTIATNTWANVASLPEPRAATHAVLAPDGRIYLPGGANLEGGTVYKTVVAYSAGAAPLADRWSRVASLAGARYRHGVGVGIDGRIYVVAGSDLSSLLRTVEAYGPVFTPSPTHVQAAQMINVSGSNFAKNATVRFSLGSAAAAVIGTGTTDASGVLPTTAIMIPAGAAAGATRLYATDTRSRYPVSVKFTVDP